MPEIPFPRTSILKQNFRERMLLNPPAGDHLGWPIYIIPFSKIL